jgi:hypothetical protein
MLRHLPSLLVAGLQSLILPWRTCTAGPPATPQPHQPVGPPQPEASPRLSFCHGPCRDSDTTLLGAGSDHNYWGRADEERTPRPAWIWDDSTPASDLFGLVSCLMIRHKATVQLQAVATIGWTHSCELELPH